MTGSPDLPGAGDLVPTLAGKAACGEKAAGISTQHLRLAGCRRRSSASSEQKQGLLLPGAGCSTTAPAELVYGSTGPGGKGVEETTTTLSHKKRPTLDDRPQEPDADDACWCRFPQPQPCLASARLR